MLNQVVQDAVELSLKALTGLPAIHNYFKALFAGLEKWAAQQGLDTAETEELILWVSTVTVNPSLNISQVQVMLMSGYKGLSWTTNKAPTLDDFILVILEANEDVRLAYWQESPRGRKRLVTKRGR